MLVAVGPDVDAPIEADSELYVVDVRRTAFNASGECVIVGRRRRDGGEC